MPVCHWLPEAKHAGFPARHHVVGQTTSLHCFYFRTRTERDCGSHLSSTERPPVDVPFWRVPWKSPLLKPHHMFCTLGMPTSVASRLFERPEHVQVHVAVRELRLTDMLDERIQKSTAQYSTCIVAHCPAVHDPPPPFPCQPSPCIHIFPSTSALHICTSVGKVTSVAFLFVDVFV